MFLLCLFCPKLTKKEEVLEFIFDQILLPPKLFLLSTSLLTTCNFWKKLNTKNTYFVLCIRILIGRTSEKVPIVYKFPDFPTQFSEKSRVDCSVRISINSLVSLKEQHACCLDKTAIARKFNSGKTISNVVCCYSISVFFKTIALVSSIKASIDNFPFVKKF